MSLGSTKAGSEERAADRLKVGEHFLLHAVLFKIYTDAADDIVNDRPVDLRLQKMSSDGCDQRLYGIGAMILTTILFDLSVEARGQGQRYCYETQSQDGRCARWFVQQDSMRHTSCQRPVTPPILPDPR